MTTNLVLRVSLGDMNPEDAFSLVLPEHFTEIPAGELFKELFGPTDAGSATLTSLLNTRMNPDLPDMYEALTQIFRDSSAGRCSLKFFSENGHEIFPEDPVPALDRVLSVVIEQQYTPIDYAVKIGIWKNREALLDWLQERALLYFMDVHEVTIKLKGEPLYQRVLVDIASRLHSQTLLDLDTKTSSFVLADRARDELNRTMELTYSQLKPYDIFEDVLYDQSIDEAEFGTGADKMPHAWIQQNGIPGNPICLSTFYSFLKKIA